MDLLECEPEDLIEDELELRIIGSPHLIELGLRFVHACMAHAISGTTDVTREFENELTRLLGVISSRALDRYT